MTAAAYWVWLQAVLGFGSDALIRVISCYGSAEKFHAAPDEERIIACRLTPAQSKRLHSISKKAVLGILNECEKSGINIITPEDKSYPERLINISDPPAVLYVKGSCFSLSEIPSITVVGPRKVSAYGEKCAYTIANTLASCGFTVVSGGAIGADSAAHKGALDAEQPTVAVLGCGICNDYLMVNSTLRDRISKNGCLVSEYPPSMPIGRGSFPQRNRILSGLSNGTVVIEAGEKSGALITARHAAEQGRDVFVIPGSPSLPQYLGSNRLIADGAKMLLSINDCIEEYINLYPGIIHKPQFDSSLPNPVDAGSAEDAEPHSSIEKRRPIDDKVLAILSEAAVKCLHAAQKFDGTFLADDIAEFTGLDASSVLGSLTELEISGCIVSVPGGRYSLL